MRLRFPFAILFAAALPAQTIVYVDARAGVDRPGGGSATAPFKTVTFAVSQAPGR
jgi:hypothetical protein